MFKKKNLETFWGLELKPLIVGEEKMANVWCVFRDMIIWSYL
jgi:hypothetical protein